MKSISLCPCMEIWKIHWCPQNQLVTANRQIVFYLNASAITAVTKSSKKPRSVALANTNCHLCTSGEKMENKGEP